MQRNGWFDSIWFLTFALASSAYIVATAATIGPTFDEPIYLKHGMAAWHAASQSPLLTIGTMPLPTNVQTLPLFLWELQNGNAIDPVADLTEVLLWMRLGNLVFWWLLLFYCGRTGRLLGGAWGGRLAVALTACEINLLAHAAIATTDVAVAACLMALAYHFAVGREATWRRRVGLPALWFGLALLAKASTIVYGPLFLLVIEGERIVRHGGFTWPRAHALAAARRDLTAIFLGGLALTFVYCGSDFDAQPSFVRWAHGLPSGPPADCMVALADNLRIFSNAGEGLVRQIKHNWLGHGTYLLGHDDLRAIWYYFPVLLTIKLAPPLLVGPLLLALLRPRALVNWACLIALILLLLSPTFRVQLGMRMIFPLLTMAIVGLAAAAANTDIARLACSAGRIRAAAIAGACLGALWMALAAAHTWPHALCYVNDFWGGTRDGYRLVSDSSYDWGQGLPELLAWQRTHAEELDLWYFGLDPRGGKEPFRQIHFECLPIDRPEQMLQQLRHRYLAASTTMVYGARSDCQAHIHCAHLLRACAPTARTATFLIFDRDRLEETCRLLARGQNGAGGPAGGLGSEVVSAR
jgi:hypothetical protein